MSIFRRLKIAQPVSPRQPDKDSLLIWAQREVVLTLQQLRKVLNWATDWLGYVAIDKTDTPGLLPDKLLVDATMTETIGGPEGARTLTLGANAAGIVTEINNDQTLITNITNTILSDPVNVTNITQTIVENPVNVTIINEAQPTPATVASKLYSAEIPDPRDHGQCVCVFKAFYACGGSLWDGWTEVSPGVMQKDVAGPISSLQFDGVEVIPPRPVGGRRSPTSSSGRTAWTTRPTRSSCRWGANMPCTWRSWRR